MATKSTIPGMTSAPANAKTGYCQTMDQRIASATKATSGSHPGDVRPIADADGDNDDD